MLQISLEAARKNAKLTREQAASSIGVHKSTLANWEKGKTCPRVNQLRSLCGLYNISIDNIFLPY